jgi:tetratricopeptide (TPR) repeat protein
VVRDINAMAALPAQNESGLWQAWLLADDVVMVQALDVDYGPKGNLYTLPHAEFSSLLQALKEDADTAGAADGLGGKPERQSRAFAFDVPQNASLNPDAPQVPDLSPLPIPGASASPVDAALQNFTYTGSATPAAQDFTYTQSPAPAYAPQGSFAPQSAAAPLDGMRTRASDDPNLILHDAAKISGTGRRKLKADDPNLLLFWHEEAMRAYDNATAQSASSLGMESAVLQTLPYNAAQQQPRDPRLPDAGEIQARYAEQAMREEFTLLMEGMPDGGQDIPLESAVAALLTREAPFFGRKQKFMFTEFGLALRRKNKCELALLAHLRALRLAPGDENVLFNVARTEYAMGRPENAVERLDAALQVNPGFTAAAHFLAFLRNADRRS